MAQDAVAVLGLALIVRWLGVHPFLRELLGEINPVRVLGLVAKVLASKWLTTVAVTDLVVSLLHQGRESVRARTDTAEGKALAGKLDALHDALRPTAPPTG